MIQTPLTAWLGPFETPMLPIGGPFTLSPFGVLVAIGFAVGLSLAKQRARAQMLDDRLIQGTLPWLVLGALVGGHWGHALFYEPGHYLENPIELLYFWEGLSSTGGFLACIVLMLFYFRRAKKPFLPYGDCLAYSLPAGFFFGRLGCFAVSDHPGTLSDFPLAVRGIHPMPRVLCLENGIDYGGEPLNTACQAFHNQTALHDLGLYEALFMGALAGVFGLLNRAPRRPGFFLGLLALSYGTVRFFLDFLRSPYGPDVRYQLGPFPPFTPAQFFCLGLVVLGFWVINCNWGLKQDAQHVLKGSSAAKKEIL
jgi:phosphatidylglycerol:prolipoprotein diacylglycerol transferase